MTSLSDVARLIVDCEHKTAPKSKEGFPLIRTTDLGSARIDFRGAQRIDALTYEKWTRRATPSPGDVILAREAPVGPCGIVPPGESPALGQRTVLIRPNPEIVDPRYLCYLLASKDVQETMRAVANGSTTPHLNVEDVRRLPLPVLPALGRQVRTAEILTALDDLIENSRRRIELLEETARSLYREWFVRYRFSGTDLSPSAERRPVKLGQFVKLIYGKALKADARHGGPVPVVGSSGIIGWHDQAITDGPAIVLGRKGNVGAVIWVHRPCFPIDTTYFVESELPLVFVRYLLEGLTFQNSHAAVPGLSRDDVLRTEVWLPSSADVSSFASKVEPLLDLAEHLRTKASRIEAARDLLLPKLVTGKIDLGSLGVDDAFGWAELAEESQRLGESLAQS